MIYNCLLIKPNWGFIVPKTTAAAEKTTPTASSTNMITSSLLSSTTTTIPTVPIVTPALAKIYSPRQVVNMLFVCYFYFESLEHEQIDFKTNKAGIETEKLIAEIMKELRVDTLDIIHLRKINQIIDKAKKQAQESEPASNDNTKLESDPVTNDNTDKKSPPENNNTSSDNRIEIPSVIACEDEIDIHYFWLYLAKTVFQKGKIIHDSLEEKLCLRILIQELGQRINDTNNPNNPSKKTIKIFLEFIGQLRKLGHTRTAIAIHNFLYFLNRVARNQCRELNKEEKVKCLDCIAEFMAPAFLEGLSLKGKLGTHLKLDEMEVIKKVICVLMCDNWFSVDYVLDNKGYIYDDYFQPLFYTLTSPLTDYNMPLNHIADAMEKLQVGDPCPEKDKPLTEESVGSPRRKAKTRFNLSGLGSQSMMNLHQPSDWASASLGNQNPSGFLPGYDKSKVQLAPIHEDEKEKEKEKKKKREKHKSR